jgi:hypothetical protein
MRPTGCAYRILSAVIYENLAAHRTILTEIPLGTVPVISVTIDHPKVK